MSGEGRKPAVIPWREPPPRSYQPVGGRRERGTCYACGGRRLRFAADGVTLVCATCYPAQERAAAGRERAEAGRRGRGA